MTVTMEGETGNDFINTALHAEGIQVLGHVDERFSQILTLHALRFLAKLHRLYDDRRIELIKTREVRQRDIDAGKLPTFLESTAHVRAGDWKAAPLAPGIVDRRIEITGPVDRKMIINALNSGATQFMADFEDSSAPTWENMVSGQGNLRDAVHRTISYQAPDGKTYSLKENVATLLVRPRGLHLEEAHVVIDGRPMSGSLFDFGLYFYHNARRTLDIGAGPYFYLPKMESHLEARWWNDVFVTAQSELHLPRGTIRATVLIETIMAAFEMDEIIYELKEHSSGLNCGRWDYIFNTIKRLRNHRQFIMPDRKDVTMTTPFMDAYVRLLIKTCHRRGVHAMGGMAAQIPIRNDPAANEIAMEKVRNDKLREVKAGHDGTWVAHPGLIPIAKEIFDRHMPTPNQIHVTRDDVRVTADDLLCTKYNGSITDDGVRQNVSIALLYMEAWLRGQGCVPIHNLMEDAATAEISRSQLWQWIHFGVKTTSGRTVTKEYVSQVINDEIDRVKAQMGDKFASTQYERARGHFAHLVMSEEFPEFLTNVCYDSITTKVSQTSAKL